MTWYATVYALLVVGFLLLRCLGVFTLAWRYGYRVKDVARWASPWDVKVCCAVVILVLWTAVCVALKWR